MTKLLGIAIIRGFDSSFNPMLKGFALVNENGKIESGIEHHIDTRGNIVRIGEWMRDIRRNISKRKLEDEKLKLYQEMTDDLQNRGIDTHSYRGVYKDYSNEDLRASFPTTERLAYLLEFDKW